MSGKPEKKNDALVNDTDIPDECLEILRDLKYNGFNPMVYRETLKTKGFSENDVQIAVACYVQLGNNPAKVVAADRKPSQKVVEVLKKIDNKEITLARIAISYPAWVLEMRKAAVDKGYIGSRFADLNLPAELQDPALLCFMNSDVGRIFNARMSDILYRGSKKGGNRRRDNNTDWWMVAWSGTNDLMLTGFRGKKHERGKIILQQ
jgi:hypothetical protein